MTAERLELYEDVLYAKRLLLDKQSKLSRKLEYDHKVLIIEALGMCCYGAFIGLIRQMCLENSHFGPELLAVFRKMIAGQPDNDQLKLDWGCYQTKAAVAILPV